MELLSEKLPQMITNLRFSKSRRWNQSGASFSRPVRWLVAILGDLVVPFEFAGLQSGRTTWGLRFSAKASAAVDSLAAYEAYLAEQGIILDPLTRRQNIWQQALKLAESVNGKLADDPDLLAEIGNLVERPTALLGTFDRRYLENLPAEVLIGVMKKHQRYIPVLDQEGKLTNHFIVVRNGDHQHSEIVMDGNLQVILARFADAEFFVQEDMKKKLEDFVPKLAQLTFQKQLGSMLDKTERIKKLSLILAEKLGLDEAEMATTARIAQLCKADLASEMVVEMTALQGVMGKYYARHSGENEAVSQGVFDYYLPRSSDDLLPGSRPATVVGLADRLDSIAGLFAVGLTPTGNKDPLALRRTAIGLVGLLLGKNLDFDTRWALQQAGAVQSVPFTNEVEDQAAAFITGRLHTILLEQGIAHDVVDAVEAVHGENPAQAKRAAEVLGSWVDKAEWSAILPAFSRCVRMTRELGREFLVDPSVLTEAEEIQLYQAVSQAEESLNHSASFENALVQVKGWCHQLTPFLTSFGDVEDQALRESRLGILQRIAGLLKPYADFIEVGRILRFCRVGTTVVVLY